MTLAVFVARNRVFEIISAIIRLIIKKLYSIAKV